jgi:hypothetical protein
MKRLLLAGLALSAGAALASASCSTTCNSNCNGVYGKTYFHAREAGQDEAMRLMGVADKMHLFEKECEFYGVFSVAVGYERSFRASKLGSYFAFPATGCCTRFSSDTHVEIPSTGGNVAIDANSNARAEEFGVSSPYKSTLCFEPRIQKVKIDLDLFLGLDQFINGLWLRVMAPMVWAQYKLNPCESNVTTSTATYPAYFVNSANTPVTPPYTNLVSAWTNLGTYGDVQATNHGKIYCGSESKFRLASLDLELGYDLVRNECAQLGAFIYGVAATGNKPSMTYLFSPVAGTYNWQLGGGLNGRWTMWNKNDEQKLSLYGEIVMTHMFKRSSERILGLNVLTQAGSPWLLLKQFTAGNTTSVSYTNKIYRATDMLTRCIKVGNNFMTDLALMLQYRRCAFDFSLGYNFWYRSADKSSSCCTTSSCNTSCCTSSASTFAAGTYGIKGVALGGVSGNDNSINFYRKSDSDIKTSGTAGALATATDFVLESDVTNCIALAPSARSNKVFGYIGYNWENCDFTPYLGIGAMGEWANSNHAASQWGIYLKGGLSF